LEFCCCFTQISEHSLDVPRFWIAKIKNFKVITSGFYGQDFNFITYLVSSFMDFCIQCRICSMHFQSSLQQAWMNLTADLKLLKEDNACLVMLTILRARGWKCRPWKITFCANFKMNETINTFYCQLIYVFFIELLEFQLLAIITHCIWKILPFKIIIW
jgi:hypothetical protein